MSDNSFVQKISINLAIFIDLLFDFFKPSELASLVKMALTSC